MRRSCLLAVSAGILFGCGFLQGEAVETSLPPDYQKLAADFRGGGLSQVRNSLGDALASEWRPCRCGFPGSCSLRNFAGWVDLYQWLDLLESDEAAVTKRWLSRHISMSLEKRPKGENVKATILQPGSPLVRRYDDLQHRGTEQLARDPATLGRVMDELVAPAFVSRNGPLMGRLDPGFVAATAADSGFLKQWSESFSEDDFAPKVLLNLQSIWKAHPEDWHEFLSLAIAIAVVKDQPAPDFWPHHQVNQRDIPRMEMQPDDLFSHWVRACREGKLMMDPRRLEAKELKFVIDAPVAPSEFDWVRNSRAPSRQNLRETFASVNYDRGRVTRQLFIWPWGSYRLSSIRAHGGICVDQAYYAALWGKALGIPTIFFAGQGTAGGHAWIGQLRSPGDWDLTVGRYENQNFATGEALDPQTWAPITDHDIEMISRHFGKRLQSDAARRDLVMAWNFRRRGDAMREGLALRSAMTASPESPETWDAREDWLRRTGSGEGELRAHHEAAIRQFARFRDIKTQHEEALVRLALESGNRNRATEISERIVHENLGRRKDLSADAAGSLIASQIATGDINSAVEEFYRQLTIQGGHGGGEFFHKVVSPVALALIQRGSLARARHLISQAYLNLNPVKGSALELDLRKLWMKTGGRP